MPLALVNPAYGLGLAVGVGLANLTSPFGWYDYALMPMIMFAVTQIAFRFRQWPWATLPAMALALASAIAYFPLWLGGGIPWWPTVFYIWISLVTLYFIGYAALRRTPLWQGDNT